LINFDKIILLEEEFFKNSCKIEVFDVILPSKNYRRCDYEQTRERRKG